HMLCRSVSPSSSSLVSLCPIIPLSYFPSFFFSMLPPPPRSTLFPYTTLFRSRGRACSTRARSGRHGRGSRPALPAEERGDFLAQDRKSTRLNSSHRTISYAVFCLKKKKKKKREYKNIKSRREKETLQT